MKLGIQLGLFVVIVLLAYFLYESIAEPMRFQAEKDKRYAKVIQNLKDIRTAELAYKDKYGFFADDFDKLENFVKYDSLEFIRKIGEIPDHLLDSLTEAEAVKMELIIRDTISISVLDTVFGRDYAIDSLRFVPFTSGAVFTLGAGEIETGSKVKVKVFEAKDTKPFDPNQVLQVGSLTETTNNSGNWE